MPAEEGVVMSKINSDDVRRAWLAARLVPLWESPSAHKPPQPPQATHIWKWDVVRPLVELALRETSPAAVERRVLQYVCPEAQLPHEEHTVGSIAACVQALLPGEMARPHRHTMNAIRFVLEGGDGAITTVDGKDCPMKVGDLVLTPAWSWHGHRHDGDQPTLWLDVLDVPLHNKLGTVKFQPPPMIDVPRTMSDDVFSVPNILPVENITDREYTPVFRYPYEGVLAALRHAPQSSDGARRVRYVNPRTGRPAMALLDCQMMAVDKDTNTRPRRSNANMFCMVVEGEGESMIGDTTISWGPKDGFTIPQMNWSSHRALSDNVRIFTISDRDAWERLGLLEEVEG